MVGQRELPPFRADHVGSLIRPRRLIEARREYQSGRLAVEALHEIEDEAIREAVRMQERVGLQSITDGEMRRFTFRDLFFESVSGFSNQRVESSFTFTEFSGQQTKSMPIPVVVDRLRRQKPMTAHEFAFTKGLTKRTVKATLPSPGINHVYAGDRSLANSPYRSRKEFMDDVVSIYRAEVADLAEKGCRYLQIDETPTAYLCDPKNREMIRARGENPDELIEDYNRAINEAVEKKPSDMVVCAHLCRGNIGHGLASGGYEPVAERLFRDMNVNGFFLEYDTERAGDFKPLRHMPKGKFAVLGLVSTKITTLESGDEIKRRVEEATRYIDLDQLCLSPQCGFASNFDMERMTIDDEERKLAMIVEIAAQIWN